MSHPIGEVVAAAAVVLALGASTLFVLPKAASEPPHETIVLDAGGTEARRAVPRDEKTNVERVAALERQLHALAAEHSELSDRVKAITRQMSQSRREGSGR